jgi:arabinogalactan endo-1,4-beta-galactosidase
MKAITRRPRRAGTVVLALLGISTVLVVAPSGAAFPLSGTAEYTPAESNIAVKDWVSGTATKGHASLAIDGNTETAWMAPRAPAALTVDLGGAYDAVHKVETVFASNRTVYTYKLQGSKDGHRWTTLADRSRDAKIGSIFTDVFSFKGLRYVRLAVASGSPIGVRELRIINYLLPQMDNGSDTSEQGGNTNTYFYNAGNNPPVPGVRGGKFTDPGSIESGNNFFGLTKDLGWDTTRLRVWNQPKSENSGNPVTSAGNNSPENTRRVAKAVVGAGQNLAIDLHYADSWADPQNQPKPYAWANLPFDDLVQTTYQYTYDFVNSLVDQGTPPTIVALGNEITNGMMWGSEYDLITPYVHHHDYYNSGRYLGAPGGGIKWLKYEEANGDKNSAAYHEFLDSVKNLSLLVDAGNRAIKQVNRDKGLHIQSALHFAFNVFEQPPTGKIALDPDKVLKKVMTLINGLSSNLDAKGGMVDRIGLSYYPDWHGTYAQVQRNLVEISKVLPGVKFNIAETSPKASGTVTDPMSDPNHPVGFNYTVQSQGDDTMDIMKVINDIPNNVGTGVWPWAGTNVFATGSGANGTLRASFKVWNDAFAKNVLESSLYVGTCKGVSPVLPVTVKSLDLQSGVTSRVRVIWDAVDPASYASQGTFTVHGTGSVTVPAAGRGVAMKAVTATVEVTPGFRGCKCSSRSMHR